jgi:hypothetical protein
MRGFFHSTRTVSSRARGGHGFKRGRVPRGAYAEAVEGRVLLASVSINDAVVTEGNAGTVDAVFTVTLNQGGDLPVSVNYTTADSSATTPADYQPISGTLTFTPGGPTTQTVVVKVVGDTSQENNEQFSVNLNTPVNATIVSSGGSGTGYIVDDDDAVLTIQNVVVPEGDTGTSNAVFTVTRSGSTAGTTTVNYTASPSSATSPADYVTTSGTLTFAPGETSRTFNVGIVGDTLQEGNEQFSVALSGAVNATVDNGTVTATIIDDDASTFTVRGGVVREGDQDPGVLLFTVNRQGSLDGAASVNYATQASTATAGNDFVATSGVLNFAPGEASKQVAVPIMVDTVQEATEQFFMGLSNAVNATTTGPGATGTIVDDDAVSWSIEAASTVEGDTGTRAVEFKVRRAGQTSGSATIGYATANSTAAAPADFVAANGNLTFAPGEAVKSVVVQVNGDTAQEATEGFNVNLSNPSTGTVAVGSAQGIIVDDDQSYFSFRSDDVAVPEGNSGNTPTTFTVTRYGSLDGAASVNYTTTNGTAATPSDYALVSGTLNFAPGEVTKTITVNVAGDTAAEANEYFYVTLSGANNATLAENQAPVWIANDDAPVTTAYFFLGDASVVEGDSGTTPATFTVRRLGDTGGTVNVNYSIPAPANGDYQVASGTLTFGPGETSKTFTINVVGDGVQELVEAANASLSAPSAGSQIADNVGQLTVVDDDDITLWVSDASVVEGDSGTQDVHLTVRRFGKTVGQSSVNYTTSNNTATSPTDFQIASGTVTFAPGEDTKDVVVKVVGDTTQENNETFILALSGQVNGTVEGGNGSVFIFDDDDSSIAVGDVVVTEGTGGNGPTADFVVARYGSVDGAATVNYTTTNSSATAPGDYTTVQTTLTFAPGETSRTVSVVVTPDTLQEGTEQFFLDFSAPSNVDIARNRATGVIVDDDDSVVALTAGAVVEGDAGTRDLNFTVTRYGSLAGTASVEFRTNNSSAIAPGDYTQVVQSYTFAAGETSKTIPVQVNGDTTQEGNELFTAFLQSPNNTTVVSSGNNYGQILDDDESFLVIDNVVLTEGDPGSPHTAVLTVRRFGSLDGQATVNYATQNSSATAPGDYTLSSGTLTFAPGVASQTINIPITADRLRENEELFLVNLSAAVNATLLDGSGRVFVLDDDPAPAVAQVFFSSTAWAGDDGNPANTTFLEYMQAQGQGSVNYGYAVPGGAAQLSTLPWVNVDRVSIRFTQPVVIDAADLQVRGVNTPTYSFLNGAPGFNYDATNFVATWTFDKPLARDKIILDLDSSSPNGVHNDGNEFLDGEWNNGGDAYPSGNGLGGGDFLFRTYVLPGDVDHSQSVLAQDFSEVKKKFFKSANEPGAAGDQQYTAYHDINGDGIILAFDYSEVKKRFFDTLPIPNPTASLFGRTRVRDLTLRGLLS